MDEQRGFNEYLGILSSLIYLRGEAMELQLSETQKQLKLSYEAFFSDLDGVDTINRDLEKIRFFLSKVENLNAQELSALMNSIIAYNLGNVYNE